MARVTCILTGSAAMAAGGTEAEEGAWDTLKYETRIIYFSIIADEALLRTLARSLLCSPVQ